MKFKTETTTNWFEYNLHLGTAEELKELGFPEKSLFVKLPYFQGIGNSYVAKTRSYYNCEIREAISKTIDGVMAGGTIVWYKLLDIPADLELDKYIGKFDKPKKQIRAAIIHPVYDFDIKHAIDNGSIIIK